MINSKSIFKMVKTIGIDLKNLSLTIVTYLIAKDNNLWIFGSWFGESYCDNSKYLFEYINESQPNIKAIWITKSRDVFNLVKSKGYLVYMYNTPKGIYYTFRAKIGIVSASCQDINSCYNKKINFIWLWHGTPLKKIKYDAKVYSDLPTVYNRSKIHNLYNFIFRKDEDYRKSMFIAASKEVQSKIISAFKLDKEQVKITGYPRNDAFFKNSNSITYLEDQILNFKRKNKNIIIYMPTFRKWGSFDLGNFLVSNLDYLNTNLEKLNSILLIKLHHGDMKQIEELNTKELVNIVTVNDTDIKYDIYPILKLTDILITDYSSIYFDYLLLNKPIIFAPFDFDDYQKLHRTFYYNYNRVTPGVKALNWQEVILYIKNILNGKDTYDDARERINNVFNYNLDGFSSKRVFNEIISRYY